MLQDFSFVHSCFDKQWSDSSGGSLYNLPIRLIVWYYPHSPHIHTLSNHTFLIAPFFPQVAGLYVHSQYIPIILLDLERHLHVCLLKECETQFFQIVATKWKSCSMYTIMTKILFIPSAHLFFFAFCFQEPNAPGTYYCSYLLKYYIPIGKCIKYSNIFLNSHNPST